MMTRKIFPNSSLASEAFELVRFRNISTAITDSPKRYNKTNWPPSNMIFGNRNQTTTPGLRANNKIPIQNANGMMMEARLTETGRGSVNRKTQFGMINKKPNKKYKCFCEDNPRKMSVKYFIDFYLKIPPNRCTFSLHCTNKFITDKNRSNLPHADISDIQKKLSKKEYSLRACLKLQIANYFLVYDNIPLPKHFSILNKISNHLYLTFFSLKPTKTNNLQNRIGKKSKKQLFFINKKQRILTL